MATSGYYFDEYGPRVLSELSLDSSRRVLYNDTLFEVPGWPMAIKCTLAKKCYCGYILCFMMS